ncbi:putative bifunctional diguanylate cyclase/phosphodiesterase [Gluconobacter morbifer]|uniref:Sensory box/GGDEF family protein n=1 Tax=Gluconobacter morbifer G707 TaxID=1088869 RepID=G6XKP3_9PROT|nr:EAL domain-containing protein [Gluconobacter morbifer]EHH67606.1 hypothetical protein GMO_20590 [Gluconobacter morbifer G707]
MNDVIGHLFHGNEGLYLFITGISATSGLGVALAFASRLRQPSLWIESGTFWQTASAVVFSVAFTTACADVAPFWQSETPPGMLLCLALASAFLCAGFFEALSVCRRPSPYFRNILFGSILLWVVLFLGRSLLWNGLTEPSRFLGPFSIALLPVCFLDCLLLARFFQRPSRSTTLLCLAGLTCLLWCVLLQGAAFPLPLFGRTRHMMFPWGALWLVAPLLLNLALLVYGTSFLLIDRNISRLAQVETLRLQHLTSMTTEALLVIQDGRIVETNGMFCRELNLPISRLIGQPLQTTFPAVSVSMLTSRMQDTRAMTGPFEVDAVSAAGTVLPFEAVLSRTDYKGRTAHLLAMRSLARLRQQEAHIRHMAHHDSLTGLPNRTLLHQRMEKALLHARQTSTRFAILYLDLDRFKQINDALGHAAGDLLLQRISERIQACAGSQTTLSRIGGDEFVLLMDPPVDRETVAKTARKILTALSTPYDIEGRLAETGVSIGIALFPEDGLTEKALLANADAALLQAKTHGRNRWLFFTSAMHEKLEENQHTAKSLTEAIENGTLSLSYEPVLDCLTGKLWGYDTLVEWEHTPGSLLKRDRLQAFAETAGLSRLLGLSILENACRMAVSWPAPLKINVSLNASLFRQDSFPEAVAAILKKTGLPPSRLELGMSDHIFQAPRKKVIPLLHRLKLLGLHLALNDFGVGHLCLDCVQAHDFDRARVPVSLLTRLDDPTSRQIMKGIINLGHGLRLSVTATGVHSRARLDLLTRLGCDQVQGLLPAEQTPLPEKT